MKQSLHLVSNHLQRNRIEIEKLKTKSAQDLKHVEISQRTNETPSGLQYENTAPIGYFIQLVEEFETNMINYRKQIEDMELHLTSVGQTNSFTPQELSLLLRKLHESFMALAAHLQVVHESVKNQKDHFLNYRQIFHGDSTDVFEQRRKHSAASIKSTGTAATGPTPFSGVTNQVASAMATALNQPQQQQAPNVYGAFGNRATNTTGLFGAGTGASGFGTTFKPATTGFGSSTIGFGSSSAGTGKALSTGFPFAPNSAAASFNAPATAGGFANNSFGQNTPNQAFQLSKPPVGNKRGKKA
ncbi:hypothetical protein CAPTEDRAFT_183870 [Capitella teleta]|uniref:Nucleoporin p58/p45 n=1 Tax=Capitella teleta TaxID=283909 RepID=R7TAY8_CAPTE|nr:hypothetical protein CAPTEDRAFT_183870 [Capitella teleta]|eukprot:ELT88154.1 hypothetical protein CAPTEDRAFT_183870 [Capitella teleta]